MTSAAWLVLAVGGWACSALAVVWARRERARAEAAEYRATSERLAKEDLAVQIAHESRQLTAETMLRQQAEHDRDAARAANPKRPTT